MRSLFFSNDTAATSIYTLSLHDALPILRSGCSLTSCCRTSARSPDPCRRGSSSGCSTERRQPSNPSCRTSRAGGAPRSEEHTSELQSQSNLVCRLLLEKKNSYKIYHNQI